MNKQNLQKRSKHFQKRPTKETYMWTHEAFIWEKCHIYVQKRPAKETCKRELQKRPTYVTAEEDFNCEKRPTKRPTEYLDMPHATRCNTLQHTAPHCDALQHTATQKRSTDFLDDLTHSKPAQYVKKDLCYVQKNIMYVQKRLLYVQKRPMYVQKRPPQETYEWTKETYACTKETWTHPNKPKPAKETNEKNLHKRHQKTYTKETLKWDLQRPPKKF